MAVFVYKGLDQRGKHTTGVIDADNSRQARSKLRQNGIFPTDVASEKEKTAARSPAAFTFLEGPSLSDLSVMTRQLSTLLAAGLSLMEALSALIDQTEKDSAKKIWVDIRESVKEGSAFAEALGRHPKIFSTLYCQMVRAGEASGSLDRILHRLADYLENQVRLRNKIFSMMTYPILMMVVSLLILLFLIAYVVPKVTAIFTDLKQALPWPTVILLSISEFLQNHGWLLLLFAILGLFWFKRHISTEGGRQQYDRISLRIPLFGRAVKMVAISRFTKTLATLLVSGVQLLNALEIVQGIVGNKILEGAIQEARGNIREGESIAEPLKRSGLFPPLVTHMIAIGEKSGDLERMLQNVSDAYDNEVETLVTGMTALLGPMLILGMGLVILFIVLAILLPIFEVSQIVG
ncbi:MAG: type II secretion system inner membrane protein GspF [Nitrospiria bacterium]